MRFFTKRLALLAVLLLAVAVVRAQQFEVDGIRYDVFWDTSVSIIAVSDDYKKGDVVIPSSVHYNGKNYYVYQITPGLFKDCVELTSLEISGSYIYDSLCQGCTNLKSVVIHAREIGAFAFQGCTSLESAVISAGSIKQSAFQGCTSLTSIELSCTNVSSSMFQGCTNLATVKLPQATSISDHAFSGCRSLTTIEMPKVTSIDSYAFSGCTNLTALEMSKVTHIYSYAFSGCPLTHINIPSPAFIGFGAFANCPSLKSASLNLAISISYPFGEQIPIFSGCNSLKELYVSGEIKDQTIDTPFPLVDDNFTGTIYASGNILENISVPVGATAVKLYDLDVQTKLKSAILTFNNIYDGLELGEGYCVVQYPIGFMEYEDSIFTFNRMDERTYSVSKLPMYTNNNTPCFINAILNGQPYQLPLSFNVSRPVVNMVCVDSTQTTQTFELTASSDDTCEPSRFSVFRKRKNGYAVQILETISTEDIERGKARVTFENLAPDSNYLYHATAQYPNVSYGTFYDEWSGEWYEEMDYTTYSSSDYSFHTKGMELALGNAELSPTTFTGIGSYTEGDATVLETGFASYNPEVGYTYTNGNLIEMNGLTPQRHYELWYYVVTEEGGKDSISYTFRTPALTFETLPAKATSNTVALICAETNLSDMETGAGFEWRRYDAPELVPSTQSPCPVVDGVLTGALRNLSASTYYKFRPYYTSASGQTYYGEWSAFGTADAYVYFDPTVRTYEATSVTETEARVRGYAIAGSDEITEQGFEYWPESAPAKRSAADVRRVQAEGQFMTATLAELQPGTTYTFRVYVETAKSTTYGEVQTFTTVDDGTGISSIVGDGEAEGLKVAVRGSLSSGNAFIQVSGNGEEARWTLTGIGGAIAAQEYVRADGTWQTLDAPALPRGMYLLTVGSGKTAKTIKLLAR